MSAVSVQFDEEQWKLIQRAWNAWIRENPQITVQEAILHIVECWLS